MTKKRNGEGFCFCVFCGNENIKNDEDDREIEANHLVGLNY